MDIKIEKPEKKYLCLDLKNIHQKRIYQKKKFNEKKSKLIQLSEKNIVWFITRIILKN